MGMGPSFKLSGTGTAAIVFGCVLVLVTIGVILYFVPRPVLLCAIAVIAVFSSASVVERVTRGTNVAVRIALTAFIQLLAVLLIVLVTSNLQHRWMFLITALVMVVITHTGTAAVNLFRSRTLSRLSRGTKVRLSDYAREAFFASTLESRSLAYYGLLLGFGIGVVLMRGSAFSWSTPSVLPVLSALIGTAAFLLFEIGRNGTLMADPLYDGLASTTSSARFLSGRLKPILHLVDTPELSSATDDQIQELAYAVADLRKTIFWSSVFGATIFFSLSLLITHLIAAKELSAWLVLPTLAAVFLFVQLPYVWGQAQVHANLLETRDGVARAELQEKLQKLSPLLPRVPALVALTTTGTAGGLLYVALSKVLSSALELK